MRKAQLYEGISLQMYTGKKRERVDLGEELIRPPKQQKAEETHKLDQEQQQLLDEWLEFLKAAQEALEKSEADIKDLGKCIPRYILFILKDIQDMAKDKQTLCDVIKDNGEYHIDFCEFLRAMLEFGNAFEQSKAAIDTQVKAEKRLKK